MALFFLILLILDLSSFLIYAYIAINSSYSTAFDIENDFLLVLFLF